MTRLQMAIEKIEALGFEVRQKDTAKRGAYAYLPTKRHQFSLFRDGQKLTDPHYKSEFMALLEGVAVGLNRTEIWWADQN